jgi:hypothetical protein
MTLWGGYKGGMDKLERDRHGEIFQDELTENQSMPRPPKRDDAEKRKAYDPQFEGEAAERESQPEE